MPSMVKCEHREARQYEQNCQRTRHCKWRLSDLHSLRNENQAIPVRSLRSNYVNLNKTLSRVTFAILRAGQGQLITRE
jgi:hypothetical protein